VLRAQAEIHAINEETADDVRSWQTNAQAVQDDILRSKALASEIIKASEAPIVSGRAIHDAEAKADFLIRELNYNGQVQESLRGIKNVNQTLDQVEQARDERRILDALHLLESEQCAYQVGRALLISVRILERTGYHISKQIMPGCQAPRHQGIRAQVGRT
jgi:hypothetical protein